MGIRNSARAPLQMIAYVLAALECLAFAVNLHSTVVPEILVSVPIYGLSALSFLAEWTAWRGTGDPLGRRFWRLVTIASAATLTGQLIDIPSYLAGPIAAPSPIQTAYSVVPFVLILFALYRLPLGARSRGERQRLLFDIGTVTLAAVLFVWYFSRLEPQGTAAAQHVVVSSVIIVLMSVILFGLIKSILSGTRAVDPVALRLFGAGLLTEIVGNLAAPLVPLRPHYSVELLTRVAVYVLVVAAALRRPADGPRTGTRSSRRAFSVLPYLAVASVDALLLGTMWQQGSRRLVVAVVTVVLTVLVIVRQIGAFRENAGLLDRLGRQERRFRSLVQNAADVIGISDRNGIITYVSPGAHDLVGRTPEELVGTTGPEVHPDDLALVENAFAQVLTDANMTVRYEIRLRHADGDWRRVRVTMTNMLDDPAVGGIVTNASDITESHDIHRQLSHQASHDALTDLANRSLLGEELTRVLVGRNDRPVCLALVDLDDFKSVNDTLGHQAGDALLIAIAERLRRGVRPQDLVARLGGDEFAVLLDGTDGPQADAVAERVLRLLAAPITIDGHEFSISASVGIAEAGGGDDVDLLMRHADLALYEAKGAGKSRHARYSEELGRRMSVRAGSTAELRRALAAGEFELHYQPIVALPTGKMIGAEALLRWRHPERGLIPPLDFIPLAEETGMIVPIGRWVLAQACRDAAAWLAEHPDTAPATINVNVSPVQVGAAGFGDDVLGALAAAGLPAERLMIELVESAVVGDVATQLRRLRERGVRVALDDFGTGQSTLSLLDVCPVDELKLDRSFVRDPQHDKVAIVVATMARVLGVDAVAEGVETREQAEHLHHLGYRLAQGFHFARPVPAAAITETLRGELAEV